MRDEKLLDEIYGEHEQKQLKNLFTLEVEKIAKTTKKIELLRLLHIEYIHAIYYGYEQNSIKNNRLTYRKIVEKRFGKKVADEIFPFFRKIDKTIKKIDLSTSELATLIREIQYKIDAEIPLPKGLNRGDFELYMKIYIVTLSTGMRIVEMMADKEYKALYDEKRVDKYLNDVKKILSQKEGDYTRAVRKNVSKYTKFTNLEDMRKIHKQYI